MSLKLMKVDSASELPPEWDILADEYYQTQEFLLHAERYNPCAQRYYLFYREGTFVAGLVVYTLTINVFTYSILKIPFSMNVAGIPCSVSASGFIGDEELFAFVFDLLKPLEKGFLTVLNLDFAPQIKDVMIGHTLPTITLQNGFKCWDDYLDSLRSDYRRRFSRISAAFSGVRTVAGDCSLYSEDMQLLYLEVLAHTKGKLETLSSAFFRNLPQAFRLTAYYEQERLLGWYISTAYQDRFYFFLGGFDYQANPKYQTYFNLLYELLREGLEDRCAVLDFGQTAEVPKLRLGAKISPKWMLGYHSNFLIRKLLIAARGILEYASVFPETHTFTENKEQ